jgi:hypothetical protein
MGCWVNQNHMGGLYFTEEYQNHETCEQCGDSDFTLGKISSVKELRAILKDTNFSKEYCKKTIEEFKELIKNDR